MYSVASFAHLEVGIILGENMVGQEKRTHRGTTIKWVASFIIGRLVPRHPSEEQNGRPSNEGQYFGVSFDSIPKECENEWRLSDDWAIQGEQFKETKNV